MARTSKRKPSDEQELAVNTPVSETPVQDAPVEKAEGWVESTEPKTLVVTNTVVEDVKIASSRATLEPVIKIEYRRVDKSVDGPYLATPGSAGFDLYARERVQISPGGVALVPLNVIVKIPQGYVGLLAVRSGLAKQGIFLANGVGVVDYDYHGPNDEICALLYNSTSNIYVVSKGQRVAQLLLIPLIQLNGKVEFVEVDHDLREGSRGGFGSTGT